MHVVQSLSHVRLSVTPWTAACQAPLSSAMSLTCSNSCPLSQWWYLTILRVTITHPFLLLPSLFPNIRVFSNESALHISWLKYWSFSFSKSSFNEYSGLISFMTDCFDLLAIHGTPKSPLQHHNSKSNVYGPTCVFLVLWSLNPSKGNLATSSSPHPLRPSECLRAFWISVMFTIMPL